MERTEGSMNIAAYHNDLILDLSIYPGLCDDGHAVMTRSHSDLICFTCNWLDVSEEQTSICQTFTLPSM